MKKYIAPQSVQVSLILEGSILGTSTFGVNETSTTSQFSQEKKSDGGDMWKFMEE